jgi:hypothetical protein
VVDNVPKDFPYDKLKACLLETHLRCQIRRSWKCCSRLSLWVAVSPHNCWPPCGLTALRALGADVHVSIHTCFASACPAPWGPGERTSCGVLPQAAVPWPGGQHGDGRGAARLADSSCSREEEQEEIQPSVSHRRLAGDGQWRPHPPPSRHESVSGLFYFCIVDRTA